MFYEKLAESKQKKREGLSGLQMGGVGLASTAGAAGLHYSKDPKFVQNFIRRNKHDKTKLDLEANKRKDIAQSKRSLQELKADLQGIAQPDGLDLTDDLGLDLDEAIRERAAEIRESYAPKIRAAEDAAEAVRGRRLKGVRYAKPILGALAAGYGTKKLFDRHNARKQRKD